jgi:hypothetical protein
MLGFSFCQSEGSIMSFLKKLCVVFVVLGTLLGIYDLVNGLGSRGVSSASAESPIKTTDVPVLTGHWHMTKSGIPDAKMAASIADDKILVTLTMGDTTGIFWDGTFDTTQTSAVFKTTSLGDQAAMAAQLYASSEKSKVFTYKDGDLSFQFSIMGVSTIVHMSK